jgi:phosphoglycolate phosphatase-like HAD superfamily hydrolase
MKALIFDLDGTLVDSVYAHLLAWQTPGQLRQAASLKELIEEFKFFLGADGPVRGAWDLSAAVTSLVQALSLLAALTSWSPNRQLLPNESVLIRAAKSVS